MRNEKNFPNLRPLPPLLLLQVCGAALRVDATRSPRPPSPRPNGVHRRQAAAVVRHVTRLLAWNSLVAVSRATVMEFSGTRHMQHRQQCWCRPTWSGPTWPAWARSDTTREAAAPRELLDSVLTSIAPAASVLWRNTLCKQAAAVRAAGGVEGGAMQDARDGGETFQSRRWASRGSPRLWRTCCRSAAAAAAAAPNGRARRPRTRLSSNCGQGAWAGPVPQRPGGPCQ